jgi:acetyltransferase-like isoleucine patch superfamily enzyme
MDKEKIRREIFEIFRELRDKRRHSWKRVLPVGDEISDRWEKARYLGFGEGTSIYDSSLVIGDVKVGVNTWIGPFTVLDGSGGLVIGDFCSISSGVHIYSHDTIKWALSGGKAEFEREATKIGNCCYIGSHTVITKGVTIGDHCLIGTCSLVNRNIPPYSIALGIPCRPAGRVYVDESGKVNLVLDTK